MYRVGILKHDNKFVRQRIDFLLGAAAPLLDDGIELSVMPNANACRDYDVCVASTEHDVSILDRGKWMIFARSDRAYHAHPIWSNHPNVVSVFQVATPRNAVERQLCKHRPFYGYIDTALDETKGRLNPSVAKKIKVFGSFGQITDMGQLAQRLNHGRRPIDVFYRGQSRDEGTVKIHRDSMIQKAQEACHELGLNCLVENSTRNRWTRKKYYESCMNSKIMLSPYGFGETCYRDFEAILAGCEWIKPDCRHILTAPDIYREDNHVYCQPDWADMREALERAISRWDTQQSERQRERDLVLGARTPRQIATQFKDVLGV